MSRNKTLFIYNTTKSGQNQEWRLYSEGVIDQTVEVGAVRKTFTLSLSGDTTIQFGVDDTIFLKAIYNYQKDSWKSETKTPKEIEFSVEQSAVTVSSSYTP